MKNGRFGGCSTEAAVLFDLRARVLEELAQSCTAISPQLERNQFRPTNTECCPSSALRSVAVGDIGRANRLPDRPATASDPPPPSAIVLQPLRSGAGSTESFRLRLVRPWIFAKKVSDAPIVLAAGVVVGYCIPSFTGQQAALTAWTRNLPLECMPPDML